MELLELAADDPNQPAANSRDSLLEERAPNATVCVIGAGIAGLVTAKTLIQDGFDVTVIERDSNLGGTWAPSRAYPGLRTNNSKNTYEFSDLSYLDTVDTFPHADQVLEYLQTYAQVFEVLPRIRFGQEVVDVSRSIDNGKLTLTLQSVNGENSRSTLRCDYVAVCNGAMHKPAMPAIKDADRFGGRILHSSDVSESTYEGTDKVLIVGGGKSAFDCAAWAARKGLSPTLVYRRAQWMAPRYLPGGRITGDTLVTSRLMSGFLRYHRPSTAQNFMQSIGKPLVRTWWALIALGWKKDLQMPKTLEPAEKPPEGLEKIGVGDDFYRAVNNGDANAVCGSIEKFYKDGVELADGTKLPANVVVFATGWQQDFSFLAEEIREQLIGDGYYRLYRQILLPTIQNIGFIGYASSYSCTVTSEIAAHWLSEHFLGSLELPSVEQMNDEIDRVHQWSETYLPYRGTEGFIGPFIPQYVDELMGDLKHRKKRMKGFFAENFSAFRASRYVDLAEERSMARAAGGQ